MFDVGLHNTNNRAATHDSDRSTFNAAPKNVDNSNMTVVNNQQLVNNANGRKLSSAQKSAIATLSTLQSGGQVSVADLQQMLDENSDSLDPMVLANIKQILNNADKSQSVQISSDGSLSINSKDGSKISLPNVDVNKLSQSCMHNSQNFVNGKGVVVTDSQGNKIECPVIGMDNSSGSTLVQLPNGQIVAVGSQGQILQNTSESNPVLMPGLTGIQQANLGNKQLGNVQMLPNGQLVAQDASGNLQIVQQDGSGNYQVCGHDPQKSLINSQGVLPSGNQQIIPGMDISKLANRKLSTKVQDPSSINQQIKSGKLSVSSPNSGRGLLSGIEQADQQLVVTDELGNIVGLMTSEGFQALTPGEVQEMFTFIDDSYSSSNNNNPSQQDQDHIRARKYGRSDMSSNNQIESGSGSVQHAWNNCDDDTTGRMVGHRAHFDNNNTGLHNQTQQNNTLHNKLSNNGQFSQRGVSHEGSSPFCSGDKQQILRALALSAGLSLSLCL